VDGADHVAELGALPRVEHRERNTIAIMNRLGRSNERDTPAARAGAIQLAAVIPEGS
jgi:hypothetical protein